MTRSDNGPDMSFDPAAYSEQFDLAPDDKYWAFQSLVGPYDACLLIECRKRAQPFFELGPPSPVDLFVLAIGEAPVRTCTKVGGLPFWGRDRAWPRSDDGDPLPFLVQFDLRQSLDIVGELPGDVLLVFAHPDLHGGIRLEWEHANRDIDLVMPQDEPLRLPGPTYYGKRWRFESFPLAEPPDEHHWSGVELSDGTEVSSPFYLFQVYAVQIGAHPYLPPPWDTISPDDRILCSLPSILPPCGHPFPFLNYPDAMDEQQASEYDLRITDFVEPECRDLDVGALHVCRAKAGDFVCKLVHDMD